MWSVARLRGSQGSTCDAQDVNITRGEEDENAIMSRLTYSGRRSTRKCTHRWAMLDGPRMGEAVATPKRAAAVAKRANFMAVF